MKSYELAKKFMNKYSMTVAWRVKNHCKIIDKHLNPGEEILYVFAGQKNDSMLDLFHTCVIAFTNKRIMIATDRVLFGYFFRSITPDMYNDLTVSKGIIWGKVVIDTIKEVITITNVDAKALDEVETNITEIMIKNKKSYNNKKNTETN